MLQRLRLLRTWRAAAVLSCMSGAILGVHAVTDRGPGMMLDTATLRVAFGVVTVTVFALFYLVTFRHTRSAYSAWWCAALILFSTGSAAYLFDGTIHQRWANPLGNALLVMGSAAVWAGARSLRTVRPKAWLLTAGPGVTLVASLLDNPASNDWSGGAVYLGMMSLMIALASGELWLMEPSSSRIQRPMALASGLLAAYYLCRWMVFVAEGPRSPVFLAYFGSAVTTLGNMALIVVVSFSMAALSNEQLTRDLSARATRDGLTGLLNRAEFLRLATAELRRRSRTGTPVSLILADLDHFKTVNDRYGHTAGDSALQCFAAACMDSVRSTDLVGRYGGEEFILLLSGADADHAEEKTTEISRRLEAMQASGGLRLPTVSYGIASSGPGNGELKAMIAAADAALYRAKSMGRNRAVRWTSGFDMEPRSGQMPI